MAYLVADSYKNWMQIGEPINAASGRPYIKVETTCDRCGGSGIFASRVENGHIVPHPAYGGVCLKCNGTGKLHKHVRVYTDKEAAKNAEARKRKAARRAERDKERLEANIRDSEENKKYWMKQQGFGEDGLVWVVYGQNTYSIKDQLKKMGCLYSPLLGWHSKEPLELPEGYGMISFSFDDLYTWIPQFKRGAFKPEAEEKIKTTIRDAEGSNRSQHVGQVGERLRDVPAIYKGTHGYEGNYGWTYIHTFQINDDALVWFTSKKLDFNMNDAVYLTATIKKHDEHFNVKETIITRAIVKPASV